MKKVLTSSLPKVTTKSLISAPSAWNSSEIKTKKTSTNHPIGSKPLSSTLDPLSKKNISTPREEKGLLNSRTLKESTPSGTFNLTISVHYQSQTVTPTCTNGKRIKAASCAAVIQMMSLKKDPIWEPRFKRNKNSVTNRPSIKLEKLFILKMLIYLSAPNKTNEPNRPTNLNNAAKNTLNLLWRMFTKKVKPSLIKVFLPPRQ